MRQQWQPCFTPPMCGAFSSPGDYTNDGSAGGGAVISTVAAPAETAKHGYIAQLTEATGLQLTAPPATVNEASSAPACSTTTSPRHPCSPAPSSYRTHLHYLRSRKLGSWTFFGGFMDGWRSRTPWCRNARTPTTRLRSLRLCGRRMAFSTWFLIQFSCRRRHQWTPPRRLPSVWPGDTARCPRSLLTTAMAGNGASRSACARPEPWGCCMRQRRRPA